MGQSSLIQWSSGEAEFRGQTEGNRGIAHGGGTRRDARRAAGLATGSDESGEDLDGGAVDASSFARASLTVSATSNPSTLASAGTIRRD
jgi:hypothetical protein